MIKRWNGLNLKTKATMSFAAVFLIMFFSALVGYVGLIGNNLQLENYNKLTQEEQMANEIDTNLYAQRLYFKKYQTSHNNEYVTQFNNANAKMNEIIKNLQAIDTNQERQNYISQIQTNAKKYQDNFSAYILLDVDVETVYAQVTSYGNEMTDALTILSMTAQNEQNIINGDSISNALAHMLTARLWATKYMESHKQADYDIYSEEFKQFMADSALLKNLETDNDYKNQYFTISKYTAIYKNGMEQIQSDILKLEALMVELDQIGPAISDLTTKIKNDALKDELAYKEKMLNGNQRNSLFVGLIFIFAICVGSVVIWSILKLVLNPINFLKETFENISTKEASTQFRLPEKTNDEIGLMSKAFNVFMLKIEQLIEDVKTQSLIKTSETEIAEIIRVNEEFNFISSEIIEYICKNFDMLLGAIYLPKEDQSFVMTGSYAYTNRKGALLGFEKGTGIIGQVIQEKKMFVIHELPEDYVLIQSGLGGLKPSSLLLMPCLNEGELVCILELGRFSSFDEKQIYVVEALANVIGRQLTTVKVRQQMRTLLDQTLKQSEVLQIQQEELRQSNEELEEQTRALKESENKLQIQQEELRVSNEELETHAKQLEEQKRILNEKNTDLLTTQEEMIRKAEALEQANRYKSEFLANMSHELRTPLNSILVLSQLLAGRSQDTPLTEKEKTFADTIHSSGQDLLTLINGVLDLSKVEAGKLHAHNEKVYLKEIVSENSNMFESMADMKKLKLIFSINQDMPEFIVTDSLRLNQIIKNLLSNAIKFTHEGKIFVTFRALKAKEKNQLSITSDQYIAIEVKDTGIGIPHDKLEEVFEAFKQSDGTTSRQYGGTGLGLTISLKLANLLGGHILLESEVHKGSDFTIIIPKAPLSTTKEMNVLSAINLMHTYDDRDGQEVASPTAHELLKVTDQNEQLDDSLNQSSTEKHMLIIEDDQTFSQVLAQLSQEKGYKVSQAYSGKEGIRMAKKNNPTGIILDIGLPDMDGMILAKMLSEDVDTRSIPIHIISGSDVPQEVSLQDEMPSSIIGFLKKPVDIKAIYQTLSKIEKINQGGHKKILVVGRCGNEDFSKFTQLGQVEVMKAATSAEAIEIMSNESFACVILDVKLSDANGLDFMTKLRKELEIQTPIIIYTEEEIEADEIDDISKYAETIILKSSKSKERLVDEVSLFLHDMKNHVPRKGTSVHKSNDQSALNGIRVLLADDDQRNVFALLHLLEQNGMQVIVAKDGFEAVHQFETNTVDIVLMDIMMPKMDGYEAIAQIRSSKLGNKIPIIALTAKAMTDDREKCIQAGANDYLTKPVDAGRLLSMMKVWLS